MRPARMKRVGLIIPQAYTEEVIKELGKLGSVELADQTSVINEFNLKLNPNETELAKCAQLERRLAYLAEVLEIVPEKQTMFGAPPEKKVALRDSSVSSTLDSIEYEVSAMEKEIVGKAKRLEELLEQKAAVKSSMEDLVMLESLGVKAGNIGESRFLCTYVGIVPSKEIDELKNIIEDVGGEVITKYISSEETGVVLIATKDKKDELEKAIGSVSFRRLDPGEVKEYRTEIEKLRSEMKRLKSEEVELKNYLEKARVEKRHVILALKEAVHIQRRIIETSNSAGKTRTVAAYTGWIPKSNAGELKRRMERISPSIIVALRDPTDDEPVPTLLNSGIFKPFESITALFGLPKYNETDPTPIIAITFPLIFGMIFGDVGQGGLIGLGGLIVLLKGKHNESLRNFGIVLLSCGIAAMVFGFLYGNIFGIEDKIIKTVWVNPFHSPKDFLVLAIFAGVAQITLGLMLDIFNKIREKHYVEAVFHPLAKIVLFLSAIYLVFGGIDPESGIKPVIFIGGIGLPLLMLMFAELAEEVAHHGLMNAGKMFKTAIGGLFEVYETPMGLLANTISYSRIFALALVHAGLNLAMYSIAKLVSGIAFGIPEFIVILMGTTVIVLLEGLMVFLHTLRLHYYEWFSKFYKAEGREFTPFRIERKYSVSRS